MVTNNGAFVLGTYQARQTGVPENLLLLVAPPRFLPVPPGSWTHLKTLASSVSVSDASTGPSKRQLVIALGCLLPPTWVTMEVNWAQQSVKYGVSPGSIRVSVDLGEVSASLLL
jgi:hypothetical protein